MKRTVIEHGCVKERKRYILFKFEVRTDRNTKTEVKAQRQQRLAKKMPWKTKTRSRRCKNKWSPIAHVSS